MSTELEAARRAALVELRRQPRARPWWHGAAVVVLVHAVVAAVVMTVASWSRHPRAGEPVWWVGAALLAAVVVRGVFTALQPGGRDGRRGFLVLVGLALGAASLATTGWSGPAPLWHDADCALAELGVSLVPALVMTRALSAFSFAPGRAWVGGLAAGATGLLVLHLTCPVGSAAHWLAFHAAPYVAVAWATAGLRARVPSRSAVP